MSYVWTPEQVKRYVDYYALVATRNSYAYLTYETTQEYARSVLPPCLEPTANPQVTVSVMSFMEVIEGTPNRPGRDRCAMVHIDAQLGDRTGVYYLTVLETEEVNVETGREMWGMPKKLGTIDMFDDGERYWAFAERKNYKLIDFTATLGAELGEQPAETEFYFELRGHFGAGGATLANTELVVFELNSRVNRHRDLTDPTINLGASPVDPGIATIPLGDFVGGGYTAGEMSYSIVDTISLDGDGSDYSPYLLGRLYDDWPDVRDAVGRPVLATRL